jgi:hypothetical protein
VRNIFELWLTSRLPTLKSSITDRCHPAPAGYHGPGIDHIRLLSAWVCVGRTGFIFSILALVSLLSSLSASVALSVVAAACLNYFFTRPLFYFRIDLSGGH